MPSQHTFPLSLGSHDLGAKRKKAYLKAAEKLENGNVSLMIVKCVDKALGIKLPLPKIGRPRISKP